jgi:hypothetical protein
MEKHQGEIDKAAKSISKSLGNIFGGKKKAAAPAK